MIIVEGPDRGGKSSLCTVLSERLGVDLSDDSKRTDRDEPEFRSKEAVRKRVYRAMTQEAVAKRPPVIHDRLFWSEMVYSEVFGRDCAFSFSEQRMISRLMLALEVPIIFCIPDYTTLAKGMLESEHMDGAAKNMADIYAKYSLMLRVMKGARRDISTRISLTSAKNLSPSTIGHELSIPRAIHYDYENPRHQGKVVGICQRYLTRRALRSSAWIG